jgi:dipeptidyl aminopeptidase/acylaminoacyl peptidase
MSLLRRGVAVVLIAAALTVATAPRTPARADESRPPPGAGADDGDLAGPVAFTVQRLPGGHTLTVIAYALNDVDVVEFDRAGMPVWRLSAGLSWTHSAQWLPDSDTILIADTHNNRVIEVDRTGRIVWRYANPGLLYPNDADRLANGNTLITVRDADLVVEVTPQGKVARHLSGAVDGPHNADALPNGNWLIANSSQDRVIEVGRGGREVWRAESGLSWPRDADRLADGRTLIADSGNGRVIEVDRRGRVQWEYADAAMVYDADRLPNGRTLLTVNVPPRSRLVEVDRAGRESGGWICRGRGTSWTASFGGGGSPRTAPPRRWRPGCRGRGGRRATIRPR